MEYLHSLRDGVLRALPVAVVILRLVRTRVLRPHLDLRTGKTRHEHTGKTRHEKTGNTRHERTGKTRHARPAAGYDGWDARRTWTRQTRGGGRLVLLFLCITLTPRVV